MKLTWLNKYKFLLWHKIILTITGSTLILALGFAFSSSYFFQRVSDKTGDEGRRILAAQTEEFLEKYTRMQAEALDFQLHQAKLASCYGSSFLAEQLAHHGFNDAMIQQVLATLFQSTGSLDRVFFILPSGKFYCYPETAISNALHLREFNLSLQLFLPSFPPVATSRMEDVRWSKVHLDPLSPARNLLVDAVTPVPHDGFIKGYFGVSISLSRLIAQFNREKPFPGSYSFIMNAEYKLIAAPPHACVDLAPAAKITERGIVDLQDTGNPALDEVLRSMILGRDSLEEIPIHGQPKYLAYRTLMSIDWRLGTVVPVPLATVAAGKLVHVVRSGNEKAIVGTLLWAIPLLFFALLVGGLLAERLVSPLNALTSATKDMARGNLACRILPGRKDEIGMLIRDFNYMADRIQTVVGDLERSNNQLFIKNKNLEDEIAERSRVEKELRQVESALKLLNKKLLLEQDQRKFISQKLIELLESDRRKISMELHDSLGQVLTTLKMDLEWLRIHLEDAAPSIRDRVRQARERTVTLLREAKDIAHNLRPSLLDNLGLVPSLNNLVQEMEKSTDITFHFFTHDIPKEIAPEKKTALYRVAQEALCNVIKHSDARNIFLNLVKNGPFLELSVEDDGIGFVPEQASRPHEGRAPLGLLIMQERVVQVGGEFTAESRPGEGTHLLAAIPL